MYTCLCIIYLYGIVHVREAGHRLGKNFSLSDCFHTYMEIHVHSTLAKKMHRGKKER